MFFKSSTIAVTTDASGNATVYSDPWNGRVLAILYIPDGTVPFANSFQIVATTETSQQPIVTFTQATATNTFQLYPKAQNSAVSNGAGITGMYDFIPLSNTERVKIVVSAGGNTKNGQFIVILG